MNHPASDNPFQPKQALIPSPQLYQEMAGNAMESMAAASLALLPTIPPNSHVHDMSCGGGAASHAIVALQLPDMLLTATDTYEATIEMYRQRAAENKWPVKEASTMDVTKLTFADATFTHTLMNAAIFTLSDDDGIGALKEAYRTLKPDGVLCVNTIAYGPNVIPLRNTSLRTRPEGTPPPRDGWEKWSSKEYLKGVVEKGGFEGVEVYETKYKSWTKCDFTRFATMFWSFVGGTGSEGWLQGDETGWDQAIEVLKEEMTKSEGFTVKEGGVELEWRLNVAIARKSRTRSTRRHKGTLADFACHLKTSMLSQ